MLWQTSNFFISNHVNQIQVITSTRVAMSMASNTSLMYFIPLPIEVLLMLSHSSSGNPTLPCELLPSFHSIARRLLEWSGRRRSIAIYILTLLSDVSSKTRDINRWRFVRGQLLLSLSPLTQSVSTLMTGNVGGSNFVGWYRLRPWQTTREVSSQHHAKYPANIQDIGASRGI